MLRKTITGKCITECDKSYLGHERVLGRVGPETLRILLKGLYPKIGSHPRSSGMSSIRSRIQAKKLMGFPTYK
jgi:hypothetical protein